MDDHDKDVLFITAKGIITYKNVGPFNSVAQDVKSYDARLSNWEYGHWHKEPALNYQEIIDSRTRDKEIFQIGCEYLFWENEAMGGPSFRRNFVYWLMWNYCQGITVDIDIRECFPDEDGVLPHQSFYYDLMYRMALGLDREAYETFYDYTIESETRDDEMQKLENEIFKKDDPVVTDATNLFFSEFGLPEEESEDLINEGVSDEKIQKYNELVEQHNRERDYRYDPKQLLAEKMEEHPDEPNPLKWFTTEEIKQFIQDNLTPSVEYENEFNDELAEITSKYPETLRYYTFPEEWEHNGLAKLVREIYKLPSLAADLYN